jgi:hypothetical protein
VGEGEQITLTARPSVAGGTFAWTTKSARITLNAPINQSTVVVRGVSKSLPGSSETVEARYTIGGITCTANIGIIVSEKPCDVNELRSKIRSLVQEWARHEGDIIVTREARGREAGERFLNFIGGKKESLQAGAGTAQALLWAFSGLSLPVTQIVLGLVVSAIIDASAENLAVKRALFVRKIEEVAQKSREELSKKVDDFIGSSGELDQAGTDCPRLEALRDRMRNLPRSRATSENEIYRGLLLAFARANNLDVYLKHPNHWNKWYSDGYYDSNDAQWPGLWDGRDLIAELNDLPAP